MLPGIQITFMIFCWVTILGCLASVIYTIVDVAKDRRKQAMKEKKDREEAQHIEWLKNTHPFIIERFKILEKMKQDKQDEEEDNPPHI